MRLFGVLISVLFLLALPVSAAPPVVYHSPADDGVNPGGPVEVPSLAPTTIHLYIDGGATASPADPCSQGTGDEVCAWNLTVGGQGGLTLQSFTAASGVLSNLSGDVLRCNRLDPITGELGAVKIGDLVVNGTEGGTLDLTSGESIDAALGSQSLTPTTLVTLPEPAGGALLGWGAGLLLLLARRRARDGGGS
jgi:hypothetical protein